MVETKRRETKVRKKMKSVSEAKEGKQARTRLERKKRLFKVEVGWSKNWQKQALKLGFTTHRLSGEPGGLASSFQLFSHPCTHMHTHKHTQT